MVKSIIFFLYSLSFNPCQLHGRVQIVNAHADYKVYITNQMPDVKVQVVKYFPNKPGKWQIVNSHPKFTIELVSNQADADFTIDFDNLPPDCKNKRKNFS